MEFHHIPVLFEECINGLKIKPDGIYVDGTLGGAGHSSAIAAQLNGGRLIGIDQDENAIAAATKRLEPYADRVTIVKNNFSNIKQVLKDLNVERIDGALLDLGVSSHQLDEPERGFSYMLDAPLDMRMDRQSTKSAYDVVNGYSEEELARVIRTYGEENWAKRIAAFIAKRRAMKPVSTTGELVSIIKEAIPAIHQIDIDTKNNEFTALIKMTKDNAPYWLTYDMMSAGFKAMINIARDKNIELPNIEKPQHEVTKRFIQDVSGNEDMERIKKELKEISLLMNYLKGVRL